MLNFAVLLGRLVATPELKHTQSGIAVSTFSIAVDRDYKKEGQKRETDFFDIVCWKGTAEYACKYFKKGQLIAVKGELQTRTYDDTHHDKRKVYEIIADDVYPGGFIKKDSMEADTDQ